MTFLRYALRDNGVRWVVERGCYELQARLGVHCLRFPQRAWAPDELGQWLRSGKPMSPEDYHVLRRENVPRFFFDTRGLSELQNAYRQFLGEAGIRRLETAAAEIEGGNFAYFSSQNGRLGFPPAWHWNPFTGQKTAPDVHWSRLPMFSDATGDMKYIWEPGRFACAYTLARAYIASGDEQHAETFWRTVESWRQQNPPNSGAHWKCGQEISIRIMAWCFALSVFGSSPSTTPVRLYRMIGMIAVQADRVARNTTYARLQTNNHSITEGVGLFTVGTLFPELRDAFRWREQGRKILEDDARRLVHEDGSFSQKSSNYHRLMLQDYIYAIQLAEAGGYGFSDVLMDRVKRSVAFLFQITDPVSGRVPNMGGNDGALILPLNSCDYSDFRPVVTAAHYLFYRERVYAAGPWDEDLLWFFGLGALEVAASPRQPAPLNASRDGYYTLRSRRSWALFRCGGFHDRPAGADMLHVDLWRTGRNIACDAGTYSYFAPPPWNNSFLSTAVHNTVMVDGLDQMERGPRFTWARWLTARVRYRTASAGGGIECIEGEHDGYARLQDPVTHRRAVMRCGDDIWVIIDDLLGEGQHRLDLHWLLSDVPYQFSENDSSIVLQLPLDDYALCLKALSRSERMGTWKLTRGDEEAAPRSWVSFNYGTKEPALSISFSVEDDLPCRFVSIFGSARFRLNSDISVQSITVANADCRLSLKLLAPGDTSILKSADFESVSGKECIRIGDSNQC